LRFSTPIEYFEKIEKTSSTQTMIQTFASMFKEAAASNISKSAVSLDFGIGEANIGVGMLKKSVDYRCVFQGSRGGEVKSRLNNQSRRNRGEVWALKNELEG
jgi:hypothetical protein